MKILSLLFTLLLGLGAAAQQPLAGTWRLDDGNSGKALLHLRFEQKTDGLRAVIVAIPAQSPLAKQKNCDFCPAKDPRRGKPLLGMALITGLQPTGNRWVQGTWLDSDKGFTYMANLQPEGPDKIRVSVMYGKMEKPRYLYRVK